MTALATCGSAATREYVRSASLFARVADALPRQPLISRPQLALRDLQLLDGALAEAARWARRPGHRPGHRLALSRHRPALPAT